MIILYILFFLHIFLQQLIPGVKILNITLQIQYFSYNDCNNSFSGTKSCRNAKQHVYPVASVPTSPAFHHNPRHGKHFPSQSQENIRRPPSEDGKIYLPPSYRSLECQEIKILGIQESRNQFRSFSCNL